MAILFTGRGTSGSWQCRGVQLGAAMGATVKQRATLADFKAADTVVVVKRIGEDTLAALRKSGRPWAYDILDAYPQPGCAAWSQSESIGWVKRRIRLLAPTAVIWPNQRMRDDCDPGLPGLVLRHHHRPGIRVNPIRPEIRTIGYEGAAAYLEGWQAAIAQECERRGWQFTSTPAHLADIDIVLAVRGGRWESYAGQHWKSNVKLANAHGSGTPFVGQQECGYLETASGAEYWAADPGGLRVCFDWLTPRSTREQVAERFRQRAYPVEAAAADLKAWIDGL